jgi:DNA-nicking Smr family endonuclease
MLYHDTDENTIDPPPLEQFSLLTADNPRALSSLNACKPLHPRDIRAKKSSMCNTEYEPGEESCAAQDEPIEIPIDGVLDLHTFSPKELPGLLDDYIAACAEKGILDLRIIHGKGKGVLRDRVAALLKKHPLVQSIAQAPLEAGGWGATPVTLKKTRTDLHSER